MDTGRLAGISTILSQVQSEKNGVFDESYPESRKDVHERMLSNKFGRNQVEFDSDNWLREKER